MMQGGALSQDGDHLLAAFRVSFLDGRLPSRRRRAGSIVLQGEAWVAGRGRLCREDVEPGAGDPAFRQGPVERRLVHDRAARVLTR
jgi:hypothetical protein